MPKIRVRVSAATTLTAHDTISATFIVEAPSPLSAMAKFSATANTMPYTGPVTNDPARDSDAKHS